MHVNFCGIDLEEVFKRQPLAGDSLQKNGFRKPQPFVFEKFARGHDLAACDAGEVRGEAFDLADAMLADPLCEGVHIWEVRFTFQKF